MDNEQNRDDSIHQPHDKGYKYVLSSKKEFIELLRSFVKEDWVYEIDESHVILIDKSYILPDFSGKEADLVYRVKFKNIDVIFYILLELQSTVDYQMAFRILLYEVEIWRDVLKDIPEAEKVKKDFKLPAIVPIVLYNGEKKWDAALNFKELIKNYDVFDQYLIDFKYILIPTQQYDDEYLISLSNMIGSVFLLDKQGNLELLLERIHKLQNTISKIPTEQQQRFFNWMFHIFVGKVPERNRAAIKQVIHEMRDRPMGDMVSNFGKNIENAFKEAETQGKEKIIRSMLSNGIAPAIIAKMTNEPQKFIEQIAERVHDN